MKVLLLLLVVVGLLGCTKRDPVLFEIPFQLRFEIPAGLNPFEKHFFIIRNVPTNLETLRQQFDVAANEPLTIKPASAIMTSLLQDLNFDFLEEVGISIFTGPNPDDDKDVFLTDFVPRNAGRNVNILPFDLEVTEHLIRKEIHFKVALRLRANTPTFIDAGIDLRFIAE